MTSNIVIVSLRRRVKNKYNPSDPKGKTYSFTARLPIGKYAHKSIPFLMRGSMVHGRTRGASRYHEANVVRSKGSFNHNPARLLLPERYDHFEHHGVGRPSSVAASPANESSFL